VAYLTETGCSTPRFQPSRCWGGWFYRPVSILVQNVFFFLNMHKWIQISFSDTIAWSISLKQFLTVVHSLPLSFYCQYNSNSLSVFAQNFGVNIQTLSASLHWTINRYFSGEGYNCENRHDFYYFVLSFLWCRCWIRWTDGNTLLKQMMYWYWNMRLP
jgi:hypothetical protein